MTYHRKQICTKWRTRKNATIGIFKYYIFWRHSHTDGCQRQHLCKIRLLANSIICKFVVLFFSFRFSLPIERVANDIHFFFFCFVHFNCIHLHFCCTSTPTDDLRQTQHELEKIEEEEEEWKKQLFWWR